MLAGFCGCSHLQRGCPSTGPVPRRGWGRREGTRATLRLSPGLSPSLSPLSRQPGQGWPQGPRVYPCWVQGAGASPPHLHLPSLYLPPSLCIAAITDTLKHNDLAVSVMDDRTFLSGLNHCRESANFPGLTPSCLPARCLRCPLVGATMCPTARRPPHAWVPRMGMERGSGIPGVNAGGERPPHPSAPQADGAMRLSGAGDGSNPTAAEPAAPRRGGGKATAGPGDKRLPGPDTLPGSVPAQGLAIRPPANLEQDGALLGSHPAERVETPVMALVSVTPARD